MLVGMPPPTTGRGGIMFCGPVSGRPALVRPITHVFCVRRSLHVSDVFQRHLPQIFLTCWKGFQSNSSNFKRSF